jgi:HNH endonuclease
VDWSRANGTNGEYGRFGVNGKLYMAHRIAYWMFLKKDPKELQVCHECNNDLCVNPDHLWLGTPTENTQHKIQCGRWNQVGMDHPRATVTDEDVIKIRDLYGSMKQTEIAKLFSCSVDTVNRIIYRKTWSHI